MFLSFVYKEFLGGKCCTAAAAAAAADSLSLAVSLNFLEDLWFICKAGVMFDSVLKLRFVTWFSPNIPGYPI